MGNTVSEPNSQQKENLVSVCNVIPDIPTHQYVIWTPEQENYMDNLPIFLDLRYTMDVAPFVKYKDPRLISMGMISAYIYNLLQTKFNMQWLCHADHLYYLTMSMLYQQQPLPPQPVNHDSLSIKEKYPWLQSSNGCKYVYGIDNVFTVLKEHGIVEDKMEIPSIRLSPLCDFRSYYVPKDEVIMKMALYQNQLILCNLTLFSSVLELAENHLQLPIKEDQCLGMITVIIVGYRETEWLVRFPFGHRWCDNGYCLVSMEYFNRYNRDRWIVVIDRLKQMRMEKEELSTEFTTSIPVAFSSKKEEKQPPQQQQQSSNHKVRSRIGV